MKTFRLLEFILGKIFVPEIDRIEIEWEWPVECHYRDNCLDNGGNGDSACRPFACRTSRLLARLLLAAVKSEYL